MALVISFSMFLDDGRLSYGVCFSSACSKYFFVLILDLELPERSYGADCRIFVPENPTSRFKNVYV